MYQGISSEILSDTLLAPTITQLFLSNNNLYIQAAGADADVTVEYVMADGGTYTDSATIEANRSYLFDPKAAGVPAAIVV